MPAESTGDRVTRMLAMLSYLGEHDAVPVAELAAHFQVSEAQILKDVDLLWVTGLPGYYADDLLDFSPSDYDESVISLREGQGLSRRVPLAAREALALVAAVAWLRELDDGENAEVLASVHEKLQGLVPAEVDARPAQDERRLALLRQAIENEDEVWIRYVSAEDEVTERTIRPESLATDGTAWYVEAWCHRAGGTRTFRLDRMLQAAPSPSPPLTHPEEEPPGQVDAVVIVDPAARWLAEDIPGAVGADISWEGRPAVRIELAGTRPEWLVRQVLAVGGRVLAVGPEELHAQVTGRARAALAAYGEGLTP